MSENYSLFDAREKSDRWFSGGAAEDDREESEEYKDFIEKFKAKKTTDDCCTPPIVYEAVAKFVSENYGIDQARFVRPFFPGGDYEKFPYTRKSVVVDNPPFSILAGILRWYKEHSVKFFLFAPALTLFSSSSCAALPCGVTITYENGAQVATSFLTNLEDESVRIKAYPELYQAVKCANDENENYTKKELPRYIYPDNVVTAAMVQRWCKYGIRYICRVSDSLKISALDAQRARGKAIFGKGYLLSTRAAAERAAAERAAAERAAAERAAAETWELSGTEREMIAYLDRRNKRNDGTLHEEKCAIDEIIGVTHVMPMRIPEPPKEDEL